MPLLYQDLTGFQATLVANLSGLHRTDRRGGSCKQEHLRHLIIFLCRVSSTVVNEHELEADRLWWNDCPTPRQQPAATLESASVSERGERPLKRESSKQKG